MKGPLVPPSDDDEKIDLEPTAKDNKTTNRISDVTGEPGPNKKSSKTEYYTESEPSPKKVEPTVAAKPGIDPVVWKQARVELKGLIENFGQNKYQSNNCTIKSL